MSKTPSKKPARTGMPPRYKNVPVRIASPDDPIYREGLTMTAVRRPPPSRPLTLEEALKLAEDVGLFNYSTSLDKGDDR